MAKFPPHPAIRPAVIAGASSGIGEATARLLAEQGHPVILGARSVDKLTSIAAEITEKGGQAIAVPLDVTDDASVADFVAAAIKAYGPIEIAINGAGVLESATVHEMPTTDFLAQIDLHLVGAQRLFHAIAPAMVERRRGDFIFIGSETATQPRPRMGGYIAAKAGVEAMARQARMELEGTGVRASVVCPGPVMTGMGMNFTPEVVVPLLDAWNKFGFTRHGQLLKPRHMAQAVAAVVGMPPGSHITFVEVQPEAPISEVEGENNE